MLIMIKILGIKLLGKSQKKEEVVYLIERVHQNNLNLKFCLMIDKIEKLINLYIFFI